MSFRGRIALAVACAVAALVFMAIYAADVRGKAHNERADALERYGGETALVCISSREIARGEVFTDHNVETVEWLVDLLPEGALADRGSLVGKTSASDIAKNTPLSWVDVDEGEDAIDVPAGMVAVAVPCTQDASVGGSLSPNCTVDVYVVEQGTAHIQCRGVQVIRVGGNRSQTSWVTLALPPEQVEALIAASSTHRLYFTLPSTDAQ